MTIDCRFAVLVTVLGVTGCSAGASPRPELQLSSHDAPIWVRPEDVSQYGCSDGGIFLCEDPLGRFSDRRCRCTPP
jgi:hypothetical protein